MAEKKNIQPAVRNLDYESIPKLLKSKLGIPSTVSGDKTIESSLEI